MRAYLDAAAARTPDLLDDLRSLVDIDSGTRTVRGVDRVVDVLEGRFSESGWNTERIPNPPGDGSPGYGDLLVARLAGGAPTRLLVIGHTDTVFDEGTAAARPFSIRGDRAYGPGVVDMKGGLLVAIVALEILRTQDPDLVPDVTFICNPDEEIGSPSSRAPIQAAAGGADVALVFEGAREDGRVVSARKGVTDYRIEFMGRAAHAGVEPERGRSAVLQAAHTTQALHALNGRWPGVTVNVGVVHGGTRPNVVAERCVMEVDLRSPSEDLLTEAEAAIAAIGRDVVVEGVSIEVKPMAWHRPMEKRPASAALADLAIDVARDIGFALSDAATGGASDANTTSAAGVPSLDGLGPVGGDAHSDAEWIDLPSLPDRIALAAGIIARCGEVPGGATRAS